MAASKFNIKVEAGATYRQQIVWSDTAGIPIDLTACVARMQVRKKIDDAAVMLELTTENGGIVLGGVAGSVDIVITDDQTNTLGNGVYDLEIVMALQEGQTRPDVVRLLFGAVEVSKNVTRQP